jgi:hypothetical protein
MLETHEKNRKSQQRNKSYKEEPTRNFRTEKYNDQNEKLIGGFNGRMEGREERKNK